MNKSDHPVITAVIPTYRRPKMLRRAIETVLGQTYPYLTVAVFDNASGDGTEEVVTELARRDSRVRYHRHPENVGMIANFQYGMDAVETPYFAFLCDDDLLLPGFFAHAMDRMKRNPRARFFCGQTVMFNPDVGSHVLKPAKCWESRVYDAGEAAVLMLRRMFAWTGSLFSVEVRDRIRFFVPSGLGDVDFLVKAANLFPFVVSLVPCTVFSARDDRTVHSMSPPDLAALYRRTHANFASDKAFSPEQLDELERLFDQHLRIIVGQKLKRAFLREDWHTFDLAARFLNRLGRVRPGKKIRMILGRPWSRNMWFAKLLRRYLRAFHLARAKRKSGGRFASIEDVVRIYGDRAIDACADSTSSPA